MTLQLPDHLALTKIRANYPFALMAAEDAQIAGQHVRKGDCGGPKNLPIHFEFK
ncbi:MAG: hypothetical protein ACI9ON_001344 [Limisphaerales bacterium]|jgi:hypothetical protein